MPKHLHYYGDIARCSGPHLEQIKNNVQLVNNITIKATDYDLIFSTMWSHISPPNERQIFDGMSDFYVIRNNGQVFRPADYNKLHQESLDFIQDEISNENGQQKIVVTHHVPTLMNYPSRFLGSILNEAFAVELTEMIEKHNPLYWIYGHHHQNTLPFKIGKTIMSTNQLGYVRSGEHTNFSSVISELTITTPRQSN